MQAAWNEHRAASVAGLEAELARQKARGTERARRNDHRKSRFLAMTEQPFRIRIVFLADRPVVSEAVTIRADDRGLLGVIFPGAVCLVQILSRRVPASRDSRKM